MREERGFDSLVVLGLLAVIWLLALVVPAAPETVTADTMRLEVGVPVLIIDPGHGGLDGGASTAEGTPESGFNLQIGLRLRDLAAFLGIPSVMTREEEDLEYPTDLHSIAEKKRWDTRHRTETINNIDAGFLVSIHQNYYPDPKPRGAQVLYARGEQSHRWGEITQALLSEHLDPENQRPAVSSGRDIYIMAHVQCPAILVECGFLSHPQEAHLLEDAHYQLKLAALLAESFLEITKESNI